MDNGSLTTHIRGLIEQDKLYKFYKSKEWIKLRNDVLKDAHYECHNCLCRGKYTRAVMVHHVNEVRKRPDMALSKTFIDKEGKEQKNLLPLCFACHEAEHDRFEKSRALQEIEKFSNKERW